MRKLVFFLFVTNIAYHFNFCNLQFLFAIERCFRFFVYFFIYSGVSLSNSQGTKKEFVRKRGKFEEEKVNWTEIFLRDLYLRLYTNLFFLFITKISFAGIFGVVWSFFWFMLITDSPSDQPKISREELEYIQNSLKDDRPERKVTLWEVQDYFPRHFLREMNNQCL